MNFLTLFSSDRIIGRDVVIEIPLPEGDTKITEFKEVVGMSLVHSGYQTIVDGQYTTPFILPEYYLIHFSVTDYEYDKSGSYINIFRT